MERRRSRPGVACAGWSSTVRSPPSSRTALPVAAAPTEWRTPVDGTGRAPVREPSAAYRRHRGVDVAVPAGPPCTWPARELVSFAGNVAGVLHVVVAHRNGLRTSYSFLADITVAVGDTVTTSTVARPYSVAPTSGQRARSRHVPLRSAGRRALRRPAAAVPNTRPHGARAPRARRADRARWVLGARERRRAQLPSSSGSAMSSRRPTRTTTAVRRRSRDHRRLADAVCDGIDWAAGATEEALRVGLELLARARGARSQPASMPSSHALPRRGQSRRLRRAAAADAGYLTRAALARHRRDRAAHDRVDAAALRPSTPPADGTGGSGHAVMAVSGHRQLVGRAQPPQLPDLDTDALGYDRRRRAHGSRTHPTAARTGKDVETHRDLDKSAELLAAQLRAQQAREPGREARPHRPLAGWCRRRHLPEAHLQAVGPVVSAARARWSASASAARGCSARRRASGRP